LRDLWLRPDRPARLGAGYDGKIQALSGIMSITGHAETGPTRAGFAVCDVLSGSTAAFGVSSALFQRTHTGKGQMIDVSMLEATLAFLSGQVADYSVAGHRQQLSGNRRSAAGRPPICLGRGMAICCSPATARSNTSR
jgi:crotonobetainyl-CoA:carnitine CoA-transferase CaiB-like acyl-CoA transferase